MPFPLPDETHPVRLADGARHDGTVFLSAILDHPRITVGDYTYMSRHAPMTEASSIAAALAPYLYPFSPERLTIGKFCQIAHGVQIITASANHRRDGLSTFPFAIFDRDPDRPERPSLPGPGPDTIIGHDVWIGTGAMILPGAEIGDGVIIGAGAVVGGHIAPYSVVAGNPGQIIRARLTPQEAARLQAIAWWDWPIELIVEHEALICGADIDALEAVGLEIEAAGR
ncbi:CatB-related O-acetyltransferase [Primorskyibacter sp. S187A]|uniref:CatB-related O-acetyltransferase n=1 Tax=Primorskyibacter sp. S187A TaxID=3415130 RepID=UPI003C7B5FCC